jgi:hypothetical protein
MEHRAKLLGHPIHQTDDRSDQKLVDRLAIGVDDGANVDAPSSLATRRVRG